MISIALAYCLFSWLLGGYTLLRWPWLKLRLVLQRLLLTGMATLLAIVVGSWILGFSGEELNLLNRSVLLEWLSWQTGLALASRLSLRWLSRWNTKPMWQLVAAPELSLIHI